MELDGTDEKRTDSTAFLNEGTINWRDGDIKMQASATINTSGQGSKFQVYCNKTVNGAANQNGDPFTGEIKFLNGGLYKDNGNKPKIKVPFKDPSGRTELGGSEFYAGYVESGGSTLVYGQISVAGDDLKVSGGTFDASNMAAPFPTIDVQLNFVLTGGIATLTDSTMTVVGDVSVSGATLSLEYYSTLTANSVTVASNATMAGVYGMTVNANTFTNQGLLDLRNVSETPYVAMLNLYDKNHGSTASFSQTSTGQAYLGLASNSLYSVIDVHGTASFAGTLYVWEMNNYMPSMGNQFNIINADHLSGSPTWDFTHAPLSYGHWQHGAGSSGGRDYWYIRVWI